MSYLEIEKGIPDFKKTVISFWFRAPLESLKAVADEQLREFNLSAASRVDGVPTYVTSRMSGILPLLTFGPDKLEGYSTHLVENGEIYSRHEDYMSFFNCEWRKIFEEDIGPLDTGAHMEKVAKTLIAPSFIGVEATWNDGTLNTKLRVRIQMKTLGKGSWITPQGRIFVSNNAWSSAISWNPEFDACPYPNPVTGWAQWIGTDPAGDNFTSIGDCLTQALYPGGSVFVTRSQTDVTDMFVRQRGPAEAFEGVYTNRESDGTDNTIKPDHWHHVIVSFDGDHSMTGRGRRYVDTYDDCPGKIGVPRGVGDGGLEFLPIPTHVSDDAPQTVTDPCQMWIAFDDVDVKFPSVHTKDSSAGLGPHKVTTDNIWSAATATNGGTQMQRSWPNSFEYWESSDPCSFGLPSWDYEVPNIPSDGYAFGIPSTTNMKDKICKVEMAEFFMWTDVTLDTSKKDNRRLFIDKDGKPEKDFSLAEKQFGKEPEIKLHGSSSWIAGSNKGTLGVDKNEKKIKSGQFTRVAKIRRYNPGPSLNGPQKPGDKK